MIGKVVKLKDDEGTVVILDKLYDRDQYSGTTVYVTHKLDVRDGHWIMSREDNSIDIINVYEISKLHDDQLVIGYVR